MPDNPFNDESATQVSRLLLQDSILRAVEPSFPQCNLRQVLDIGCGPGGWVIDLAHRFPQANIVGIDHRQTMITYATGLAKLHELNNVQFHRMDIRTPLPFSDSSFDDVNIRTMSTLIPRTHWLPLLKDCYRMLRRTGGSLHLTECGGILTNSSSLRSSSNLCTRLLFRDYGFEAPDRTISWMRWDIGEHLLRQAGYEDITWASFLLDFTAGTPWHEPQSQCLTVVFAALQPELIRANIASLDELETLYEAMSDELRQPSFQGALSFSVISGKKI